MAPDFGSWSCSASVRVTGVRALDLDRHPRAAAFKWLGKKCMGLIMGWRSQDAWNRDAEAAHKALPPAKRYAWARIAWIVAGWPL